jgi:hypothetical protein
MHQSEYAMHLNFSALIKYKMRISWKAATYGSLRVITVSEIKVTYEAGDNQSRDRWLPQYVDTQTAS